MNISELTKRAIQTLTKNGHTITPLLFFDTFCGEARRNRVAVEDCELIKNYIEKLDKEFKSEVSKYNIRTIPEFLSYLTSALNRMNQNHLANRHNSLLELSRKMTDAIALIDVKEIQDLSGRTNALLNRNHTPENLDDMRREWGRFQMEYKRDRNRTKLEKYIRIDKEDDIDSIIDKVIPLLEREKNTRAGHGVVDLIMHSAQPSLSLPSKQKGKFEKLYKSLRADPDQIYNINVQEEIGKLYEERVETDRSEEKGSIQSAKKIVGSLIDEVESSKGTTPDNFELDKRVNEIKEKVSNIGEDKESSEDLVSSIEDGLDSIGKQASGLFSSFKKYSSGLFDVKDKIEKLEGELNKKRRESDRDILTGMRNRQGFKFDLEEIEKEFKEKGDNYSVIVIDIDGFRGVVEKYGPDAGDLILRYFSKILKEYISIGDSTARYGEDRFLVSLPGKELGEAIQFVNKFKEKVKHTKFVYKDERVVITFSAGISHRIGVDNVTDIIDDSYKMLKEAKNRGKNCIYPNSI